MKMLGGTSVLVTGGTGSLGKTLVRRLLEMPEGPARIVVFSRDEAKQHAMRLEWQRRQAATDEVIYENFTRRLQFVIGDVRDPSSLAAALDGVDVVFAAAALKQVPTCEYFPYEAVRTNVEGAHHLVRAVADRRSSVQTVVGVSTDKAAKPVNVMGMTKAIQERILTRANLDAPNTRFVCVRYGNVLASRGSVIPLFHEQVLRGGPVTVTTREMTRFLLSLEDAVDTVLAAVEGAAPGEIWVPAARAARIVDVARTLIGDRDLEIEITGVRPGEKVHEILVSEEEGPRTVRRGDYWAVGPMLPELRRDDAGESLQKELSSADHLMEPEEIGPFLERHGLLEPQAPGELLR